MDKLADMTVDLVAMFEKYKYKDASCFGHALEGNLHLVFSQARPSACFALRPPPFPAGPPSLLLPRPVILQISGLGNGAKG